MSDLFELQQVSDENAGEPSPPGEPPTRRRLPKWLLWMVRIAVIAVALAALAYGLLRVLGPSDSFATFTLPYVQDFTDVDTREWFLGDGIWSIRDEMLVQVANLTKPASIYVPKRVADDQPYHLSTYIVFAKSTEQAGVNFNAQYPKMSEQQHQVYITRRSADLSAETSGEGDVLLDMELVAGYTDANGEFVMQISVPFGPNTGEYRLDLYVLGNTYTVQLNGQTLIDRRPLFYKNGVVGYYTFGPARFDTLKLTTAETEEPGEQVYVSDFDQNPGGAGWVPFAGEWEISTGELVQANPAALDAGIGYEGSSFENYVVQATFRHLTGAGGGILFNMVSPYQSAGAQVVRFSDQSDSIFWGYFDEQNHFTRQGFANLDAVGMDTHQLRVFVGATTYDVYLDDQLLAHAVPVLPNLEPSQAGRVGGHIGLTTSRSSVAYTLVEVFPLLNNAPLSNVRPLEISSPTVQSVDEGRQASNESASVAVTPVPSATAMPRSVIPAGRTTVTPLPGDSALIQSGQADRWESDFRGTLADAGWLPLSGNWRISNGSLVQEDALGFDLAIAYTRNAFQNYTYTASFSHRDGNGAGLIFNMPYRDRLNGAHMVRYSDRRPGGIFWGYFDADGKFVGQGYANVSPPGDARHTLRVVSQATTYNVYLDDFLLASDLPLMQRYGYLGLITVQSSAEFVSTRVDGIATLASATETPVALPALADAGVYSGTLGFPDERILSGKWEVAGGVFRQTSPDVADYIYTTGVYASHYSIEADIFLPDMPDAGGGFMLQMPERRSKVGATVVRLIRGGHGIFWGVYDQSGAFRGRGSVELPLKPEGETGFHLHVDVKGDRLDIILDDVMIAEAVALPRAQGWIGLVAFGGSVALGNVQIVVAGE